MEAAPTNMSERTKIAWTDSTFNPWWGCEPVSAGCANCYARRQANHYTKGGNSELWRGKREWHPKALKELARWNRRPWVCDECGFATAESDLSNCPKCDGDLTGFHRRRVFTGSMMDLFDRAVGVAWLAQALDAIRQADQLTHIIATKRPELWAERLHAANSVKTTCADWERGEAPPNVWLLASVEDQKAADERIPHLLRIPAAVRGLSLEPLLGPVELKLSMTEEEDPTLGYKPRCESINWLVIGGESGPGARPCNIEWIRSLVRQGKEVGVPVFVKQLGASIQDRNDAGYDGETPQEWPMGTVCNTATCCEYQGQMGRVVTRSRKGGDPSEWPEDLRRQEWPK